LIIVLFKSSISLMIFCLVLYAVESEALKSPTFIVELSNSAFPISSAFAACILGTLLLSTCVFLIVYLDDRLTFFILECPSLSLITS
jgi:hypothetical protein